MNEELKNTTDGMSEVETNNVKQQLTTVTTFSKYLALTLFITLPFIGGWIGYQYAPEKVVEIEKTIVKEVDTQHKVEEVIKYSDVLPEDEEVPNNLKQENVTTVCNVPDLNNLEEIQESGNSLMFEPVHRSYKYRVPDNFVVSNEDATQHDDDGRVSLVSLEHEFDMENPKYLSNWIAILKYNNPEGLNLVEFLSREPMAVRVNFKEENYHTGVVNGYKTIEYANTLYGTDDCQSNTLVFENDSSVYLLTSSYKEKDSFRQLIKSFEIIN